MSTLKATNLSHASAASPNIVLDSAGKTTFGGAVVGAGMDLITPTSVAGTGVTLSGGEVSFSAATSVSVNGCFTSTFANYMLIFKQTAASATGVLSGRFRASGTDNSSGDYFNTLVGVDTNAIARNITQAGVTSLYLSSTQVSNSNLTSFNLSLYSPQIAQNTNATLTCVGCASTGAPQGQSGGGIFNATTQFDGFSIFPASGTITGAVRFYGLRNS